VKLPLPLTEASSRLERLISFPSPDCKEGKILKMTPEIHGLQKCSCYNHNLKRVDSSKEPAEYRV
jgi:hypothetical protein